MSAARGEVPLCANQDAPIDRSPLPSQRLPAADGLFVIRENSYKHAPVAMRRSVGVVSLKSKSNSLSVLEPTQETSGPEDSSESGESCTSTSSCSSSSTSSSPCNKACSTGPRLFKSYTILPGHRLSPLNLEALTRSANKSEMESVERCELERPLSYRAIVHLHLSFIVDLPFHMIQAPDSSPTKENTPIKRRQSIKRTPSRVKRAFSKTRSYDVEEAGAALEDPCLRLCRLRAMLGYLHDCERLKTKGLFRLSGSAIRIRELLHRLGNEEPEASILKIDESRFTVHDVASTLKADLATVAPMLIPEEHYQLYAQIVRLTDMRENEDGVRIPFEEGDLELIRTKQLKAFRLMLLLLDRRARAFLSLLFDCLKEIAQNADSTCLTETTLGILFGPILFSQVGGEQLKSAAESVLIFNQVVELLLSWHPSVFEAPAALLEPMRKALTSQDGDVEHAASVCYVQRTPVAKTPTTAYALSELYAHIASMPDSAKKRRFIRQVSNKNGGIVSPNSPTVAHVERAQAIARQQHCL